MEIKKMFLCVILIFIGIMAFEAIFVLAILFFYGFLEFTLTAFAISDEVKSFIFIAYGSCCFTAFLFTNIAGAINLMDNYKRIKNKILEWIK